MPMPAVLGTIAQQGQSGGGSSAPTGVSVATSSAGNYDNAVIIDCITGAGVIASNDGSTFSSNTGDVTLIFSANYQSALVSNSGLLQINTFGFCRATGATSFQWGLGGVTIVQDTYSALRSVSSSASGSTAQDRTSTHMGITVNAQHNSGGRGYLMLSDSNDGFEWEVDCAATNSVGTTQSSAVLVRVMIP